MTNDEMQKYARTVAEQLFYSYDKVPSEPFEWYDNDWIEERLDDLAHNIYLAMLWSRGESHEICRIF